MTTHDQPIIAPPSSVTLPEQPSHHYVARAYTGAAIILLNLFVIFVLTNLALAIVQMLHSIGSRPAYLTYSDGWYRKVYPGLSDSQWRDLVRQTKERPFAGEAFTMFTEPEYHSRYINVSAHGFRIGPNQGPWPLDAKNFNVLVFGGSTAQGYAVADDQTIAAYLQPLLQSPDGRPVRVYNFGRRGYLSTQERILFEQLLQNGARPDMAVFIDGLNDFEFTAEPAAPMKDVDGVLSPPSAARQFIGALEALPLGQEAQSISKKMTRPQAAPDLASIERAVIDHYLFNKQTIEAIGQSFQCRTLFVFQPIPLFNYDMKQHELKPSEYDEAGDRCVKDGYPLMAQYVQQHNMGDDFLWLGDIQRDTSRILYVDKWHYTPAFARELAERIAAFARRQTQFAK